MINDSFIIINHNNVALS